MKTFWIFRIAFIASSLAFAPATFSANAQGISEHTMTANVPFGFEVGSKHLAPGTYTVSTPATNIVELRSATDVALIMTYDSDTGKPTKNAKIVFDRYGDHYFLRQVWFNPEERSYLESPESKSEKLAKSSELASTSKAASNVELALLRLP